MKSIIYIGMDVHKNTYSLCAIFNSTGEILGQTKCEANIKNVLRFIESVREKSDVKEDAEILAGYEAGCLGFSLYHELSFHDIPCVILAPSTMHGSVKNKKVKNDKMDAFNIATNLMHDSYKAVHVPTEHDNEIKEYIGLREDVIQSRKRIKQQISALVLRHGMRYGGKSNWTEAHIKWLEALELPEIVRETLDEYLKVYDYLNERIKRYDARINDFSQEDEYREPVSQITCFKGIDTLSALKIHVTISDFNRFPTAKALMSNLGMVPGENSSAEKYTNTPITKMGNAMVRKTLVECTQADDVIRYADKAVERLQRRFKKMILRGKPYNVAIMAVARELAGFIWGMETGRIK